MSKIVKKCKKRSALEKTIEHYQKYVDTNVHRSEASMIFQRLKYLHSTGENSIDIMRRLNPNIKSVISND